MIKYMGENVSFIQLKNTKCQKNVGAFFKST